MLKLRHIATTTALVALLVPSGAAGATYEDKFRTSYQPAQPATGQDLRSPDAVDAAAQRGIYADRQSERAWALNRDYGSPDAVDVARAPSPVQAPAVTVHNAPSGGFDWGDAGIGAAGMIGLFSIAGASALLLTGRRRRHGLA
jgi:hypothetical protein